MNFVVRTTFHTLLTGFLTLSLHAQNADSNVVPYARSVVGLMPLAMSDGRNLIHTRQFYPFEGNAEKRRNADLSTQTRNVLEFTQQRLRGTRTSLHLALRVNVYLTRDADRASVQGQLERFFNNLTPPLTFVTTKLPEPDAKIAMDAIIQTLDAPDLYKIPEYRFQSPKQGRFGGEMGLLPIGSRIFVSGQAVRAENVREATRKTMAQLGETLKWLKVEWKDVIHVKSFLNPMEKSEDALQEIRSFFPSNSVPPISLVEWQYRNPIEIELVVAGGHDDPKRPAIEYLTPEGMKASPVYCRVVRVNRGKLIYTSGIYGAPGKTAEAEVRDIFQELKKSVPVFGSDMKHLVKATYYVSDDGVSKALNNLRPDYYAPKRPPAASKAKVTGTGLAGQKIAIDMIAVAPR